MSFESIIYDKPVEGVARITLNRPQVLNAFTLPMVREIYEAAQLASDDPEVGVLVYRGAGRAFSSGRDFKYFAQLQERQPELQKEWLATWVGFGAQTWLHPKVTIAGVHGFAIGAGVGLAVGCDITVVTEDSKLGYPEVRRGLLSGRRLPWNWLTNPKLVKEFVFTGRTMSGVEAHEYGLANRVVPVEALETTVMELASDIAAMDRQNPGYLAANKAQLNDKFSDFSWFQDPASHRGATAERSYGVVATRSQREFLQRVETEGIHVAIDKMHREFSKQ